MCVCVRGGGGVGEGGDRRNYFMINLHGSYEAELRFKLTTTGSTVAQLTAL